MESGNWDGAVKAFGQALDNARGDACTKEAQYLAAVRLLKVKSAAALQIMCVCFTVENAMLTQLWFLECPCLSKQYTPQDQFLCPVICCPKLSRQLSHSVPRLH